MKVNQTFRRRARRTEIDFIFVDGAAALAVTMVGAIVTHLFIIGGSPAIPIVLLAATSAIAWARRSGR